MEHPQHELISLIDSYLDSGKLLHLTTVLNGIPWLSHIWYAKHGGWTDLVFTSNWQRRHSRELKANPAVAGGVVAIDLIGLGQKVRGLSFEGNAQELHGENMHGAYESYAFRWPQVRDMFTASDIDSGATEMRMYSIHISRAVLFDEVNFPEEPRQEILGL